VSVVDAASLGLHERDAELAAVEAEWQAARVGSGRLVIVEGPAGIGKTGVLRAARAVIVSEEVRVLTARAGELERHFPFGVVHQLLDAVVYGAAPDERDGLFCGAAHLATGLFEHGQAPGIGDTEVFPRLHGLFWLLANVAVRQPLLAIVDDAQWADDASLAFLAFLIRRLDDVPILLLVATRPAHGEGRPPLTRLVADPAARVVRPQALSHAAVGSWLSATLRSDADRAFVDACHATTGGNPLLVSELVREVADRRLMPTAASAAEVATVTSDGVTAVVLLRLAGMPASSRGLARSVAVLGDGVGLWPAAELAGLDDTDAAVALDALVRGGLLEGDADGLCFSHPLIRSSVYQDLGPSGRARAHERAARQLLAGLATSDEVASHLLVTRPAGAGVVVDVLREAARNAASLGAPDTASAYLRRALAEPPPDELAADVCLELGRAAARAGAPDAEEHMRRAVMLARTTPGRCRAALELARWLKFAGRAVEAVEIIDSALGERGALDAPLADALEGELVTLAFVSRSAWRLVRHRLDFDLDGRGDDLAVLGMAARAIDLATSGRSATRAGEEAGRALAGGCPPDDPVAGGYWCLMAGVGAMWADHFDLSERLIGGMLAEARRSGSAVGMRVASAMRSMLQHRRGALPDAESDARFALSMAYELSGADAFVSLAYAILAYVALERAAPREDLKGLLVELEDPRMDTDALPYEQFLHSRGCLRAALGDDRGALEDLLANGRFSCGWGAINPAVTPWRSDAALAASRLREHDLARALAAEELEIARRFGAPRALGIALRAEALVAADGTTESLLTEAVTVLEGSGARLEHARALIDLGAVVRRDGRRSAARDLLRRGLELAMRCGAKRLASQSSEELAATGARPRRIALSGVESLTPSERRVAQHAADGLTNRAIAQALFVTEKTVEGHLAHAFDKLGVRSRTRLRDALGDALPA
jgi:DNA-binding CsgD family transcriptional regulator